MATVILKTLINAPAKICFDLSRSIDFHKDSMKKSGEEAVAGKTSGLLNEGESVTWKADHFLVTQTLTSMITRMESPWYFQDVMTKGVFNFLEHDHLFIPFGNQTLMIDIFSYEIPKFLLGEFADFLVVKNYMRNLLRIRNLAIQSAAEGEDWRKYLPSRAC
jgi:ligand-binding SRPBCC domain-containing protein